MTQQEKTEILAQIDEWIRDAENNAKVFEKLTMIALEMECAHTFDLEDLGVTEQEWNEMSESEKHDIIENAVFDLPEQPYWMVGSFDER